jgi:uncharacterized protein YndB with AHSA1/START domain
MTTSTQSTDRIEKQVSLDAPRSRVWRALTEYKQFSAWFGVSLTTPFVPGAEVSGEIRIQGNVHLLTIWIETMEPDRFFSFRWHPYAIESGIDYSSEPTTLVSFSLEDEGAGTRLSIVESGFDAIPESRRAQAFSMNTAGWNSQMEKFRKFLAGGTS